MDLYEFVFCPHHGILTKLPAVWNMIPAVVTWVRVTVTTAFSKISARKPL